MRSSTISASARPTARRLTDGKSMNGGALWSNAGREIAFFTTARDGVSYDIDIVDPDSGALPHLAVTGDGCGWYPLDWSPDDRKLLVAKHVSGRTRTTSTSSTWAPDRSARSSPRRARCAIADAKFSRDGTGVYLISDRDGDTRSCATSICSPPRKATSPAAATWDVEQFALSRDGHYLAYVTNEGGADKLESPRSARPPGSASRHDYRRRASSTP